MYVKHLYCFIIGLLLSLFTYSQNNIDSLESLLSKSEEKAHIYNRLSEAIRDSSRSKSLEYSRLALEHSIIEHNDEEKGMAYSLIGQYFLFTSQYDSALTNLKKALEITEPLELYSRSSEILNSIGVTYYYKGEIDSVFSYWDRCIYYNEITGKKEDNAVTYNNIGSLYYYLGDYSEALVNFQKSLEIKLEIDDIKGIANSYNNIGGIYDVLGDYETALTNYQKSLDYSEEIGDRSLISVANTNLGSLYKIWERYDKALEYYKTSLALKKAINDKRGEANLVNNIGSIYDVLQEYQKSLFYYNQAKLLYEEIGDQSGLAVSYNNIGSIHEKTNNIPLAIKYHYKALDINEEIKSHSGITRAYLNLGKDYFKDKQYNKAMQYFQKCIDYDSEFKYTDNKITAIYDLALLYKEINQADNALNMFMEYMELKDSVFSEKKHKQITQMQTRFETEKKIQEIENQKLIIDKQNLENRRQVIIRNFFVAGAIVLALLVILIFIGYRQKRLNNIIVNEKNLLLEQANEEIRAQKDEIEAQHYTVIKQKNYIEKQKNKIDDSIKYAQHIQSALMLSEKNAKKLLKDFFVIFRPKEVVSGDFYWATKVKNRLILVVADCTGHGVSGALMSMLGISFLNEIVKSKEIINPAAILYELRKILIEAITQNDDKDMKREGMNVSLLSIDPDTMDCKWAGARSPLWILRQSYDDNNQAQKFIEVIEPDNTSVAKHLKMKDFTCKEISISKGNRLFMFTDGIIDQFGGQEGKKFSKKKFNEIILKTSSESLAFQKEVLEKALDSWQNPDDKEYFEQVDDITVMGVQV
ncbi:MAG: tetratricopeptide repeat protein [Bacteroidales bacterium]